MKESKPFVISKEIVWAAYKAVKSNDGAAGVDGESIAEFERDLKGNLYKLWNRMSSGSYFPPAVRAVEIPKSDGRVRTLGVPTVADRVAQTVVKLYLEPEVEQIFHRDSYGYRPKRSAVDAVGVCQERCWRNNWVIDLDIRAFFDTLDHELVMKAVRFHTEVPWILLYIERWLKAPLQRPDGTLEKRDHGSPQGSAISPLLANLFMHYVFDAWMERTFPEVLFERYCDDVVVHCRTEGQGRKVLDAIVKRLAECRLEVNLEKTRIVYCKDGRRRGPHKPAQFDFLGYTFRQRVNKRKRGGYFVSFNPAISDAERKRLHREVRAWHLRRRTGQTLNDLARDINPEVRGWIGYYGCYFPYELRPLLRRINQHLVGWAQRKYKRLHCRPDRAWRYLANVARRDPRLFAHWSVTPPVAG